jgi:hypothetical protein
LASLAENPSGAKLFSKKIRTEISPCASLARKANLLIYNITDEGKSQVAPKLSFIKM